MVIDSPLRGYAMPKSYSGDLRERVIEAVEIEGASRREAAERFGVSVSSGVRWLQRWNESGSAAPKPRGGSVSPLGAHEERILALIAERPDLTLKETLVELLKRRISNQPECTFAVFWSTWRHLQKKACKLQNGSDRTSPGHGDAGSESRACLTPLGWCLSTKLRSAHMARIRGRAPRGVRVIGHVPLGEWKTIMGTRQQRNSRVRTGG